MANGILAQNNLGSGVDTVIYTCPANATASVAVNFCATVSSALVRVSLVKGGVTTYIEYDYPLGPPATAENSVSFRAVVLDAGQVLKVRANTSGVHVTISGYEMPQSVAAIDA
jgi:hypothetical protein